eukprot:GHVS01000172.1.p1 GENE.GHVS01000172.1~~GHVS01000172.1.p1  ORF type:complete len:378 (-),score=90.44 GHVS01000172.1:245-1270(-)
MTSSSTSDQPPASSSTCQSSSPDVPSDLPPCPSPPSSPSPEEPSQEPAGVVEDDLFNSFLCEVDRLPVRGPAGVRARIQASGKPETKNSYKLGTADEEVARLTAESFVVTGAGNAFHALLLSAEAEEDEIKRQYKKISLLIHPDKCKNPKAHDAFQAITKAYEELQHPEMRQRYQQVVEEAKKTVLKRRNKENKILTAKKEPLLSVNETDPDVLKEIAKTCDVMLNEQQERRTYAEKCLAANDRYGKAQEAEAALDELKEREKKRKWIKERDDRVSNWREFRTQVDEKKMKLQAFTAPIHRKEQRSQQSEAATKDDPNSLGKKTKNKVPMGIDESYKANWR